MMKTMLALTAAAIVVTANPLLATGASAQQSNLKMAQQQTPGVQVAPGVQVGPGGVTVGQRQHPKCRTVRTTEESPTGRKITKTERICDQ